MIEERQLNFGERLLQLRKERGISQRDLAAQAGINFTYLSKIEHGIPPLPSIEVIRLLALALDANEVELLSLAGKVPPGLKTALQASPALTALIYALSEYPQADEVYLCIAAIITGERA